MNPFPLPVKKLSPCGTYDIILFRFGTGRRARITGGTCHGPTDPSAIPGLREKLPIRLLILWLVITLAAMLFIVFRRGQMNYANRADYILQRLDDYPRLQEYYLRETKELQTLWDDANLMSRAQQAAFFFPA